MHGIISPITLIYVALRKYLGKNLPVNKPGFLRCITKLAKNVLSRTLKIQIKV